MSIISGVTDAVDNIAAEISARQARIKALNKKIDRLEKAIRKIDDIKEALKDEEKKVTYKKLIGNSKSNWKGKNADDFDEAVSDSGGIKKRYKAYINKIDDLQDALVDEKSKLIKKRNAETGILNGVLADSGVSGWSTLEKWFN